MGTASIHEGVRRMRFSDLLDRTEAKELTQEAASEVLGISVRTFQRWAERYEAEGDDGLVDRRLGRRSPRRAPEEELERMLALYRDKYADFTVKHFHEQMQKRHDYVLGYTVTKLALHAAGLVRKAPKRSAHRKKRPRRPLRGMLLHQDGSRHVWIEGLPARDLIVTMDDATSEIYSMVLVEEEGTASTFQALREVIGEHGLFCALYTDRGSHYFLTPKAGEKISKTQQTQVGRALSHLGIEHIAAYSPQARGRSERVFGTLQDRLPKELRLAGITTLEAANAWLKAHYIPGHNAAFAIKPEQEGSAFVADRHEAWREALCVIEERTVANDNTVAWNGRRLQLPESRLRPHFVKALVRLHEYPDGTVSVFLGPHRLARFAPDGQQISPDALQPGGVLGAVKDKPWRARKRASLTAPARAAVEKARVGTEKRASSRTKKLTHRAKTATTAVA
ncbi:ISNCY family transposase [Bradyrhizobium brasilense]|uniref:ISNCY family transposase n=1 Tax=Bradyrhizobium brasilense TaxID=1419277 RepID=UPI002877F5D0|nr:ISNCY family transposase [Bradyrhizobium brasilense]MCP3420160.1 ISNCY family transposase [Bradyrhizobium brasilense]